MTAAANDVDEGVALDLLRRMLRIRRFEECLETLFRAAELPGAVHLYIGQEAVAAGVCAALRDDDYVTSTHRGHGHLIAKGGDMGRCLAELLGRATGYCRGKGGSMHVADLERGVIGANGIVGAGVPLAAGAALSARLRGTDQVSVAFFGDGAVNQGVFHETLNLAALWSLPVVFVCENNGYGQLTPMRAVTAGVEIAPKAEADGVRGIVIDGNDVVAVHAAATAAVEEARAGEGPTLIEAATYRIRQHSEGLDVLFGQTRPDEELEMWLARDPIEHHLRALVAAGVARAEIAAIDRAARASVEAALEFARSSPLPAADEAVTDVWLDADRLACQARP
jgi:pyruvate dehydrogenase E1 component alpha subunit